MVLTRQVETLTRSLYLTPASPSPLSSTAAAPCRTLLLPSPGGCRASLSKVWSLDQQHGVSWELVRRATSSASLPPKSEPVFQQHSPVIRAPCTF